MYKTQVKIILNCLLFIWGIPLSYAQNSDIPKQVSNTIFLKNGNIVKQPGTILYGHHVIIRNGIITDIGPTLKTPFDAQVILADSMYVYAGFIDTYSNTGIAKPENKDRPKIANPGNPPNDVAGITPQHQATDVFKTTDKTVSDMRAAGFCISHVVPRGLMLPGISSVYLLGEGEQDKMILKSTFAQNFQLEANRGVYPSTVIGVLAKFRELFKNAAIAGSHDEKYKLNPSGLQRPDYTKEQVALYPVTIRKVPLYFVAKQTKDVHKALALRDELGFDMVLTEVKQGWHYLDKIKKGNIPVLLSLELPEEDKKDTKKEEKKDSTSVKEPVKNEKTESNPEMESFDLKKEMSLKDYLGQASVFEKQGVKFGFSFLHVKTGDIKKNIRKMIENGLSENAALDALTTYPARLLGISNIAGTVEKNKIANLVVTDKPYFDEKSTIKYVFIEGIKYDYTEKAKKADTKPSESGKFVGVWSYLVDVPGSTQKGKITITKSGKDYKVVVVDDAAPNEEDTASDITIDGNSMTFNITTDMGQPVKVDFDLKFEDKKYSGTVSVPSFGTFPISGEYENDPK